MKRENFEKISYYPDGSIKTLVRYDKDLLHGETILYWPNGQVKRRSLFSHGKKETDTFYDEDGNFI